MSMSWSESAGDTDWRTRQAGGSKKKKNAASRLSGGLLQVFDHPENNSIKLDSKDSNVINVHQKGVWTKQRALKKSFDPV